MAKLSASEVKQLTELLKQLEPGFYPMDIFVQLARLVALSIIEFVPLRLNSNGEVEVLLLSRGPDDLFWPNELHTPGTVVRPTDNEQDLYLPFERILKDELGGTQVSSPQYVGSNFHKSKRDMEQAQVYWVEVLEDPKVGQFYPLNNLPPQTIQSQINFINLAAQSYLESKH